MIGHGFVDATFDKDGERRQLNGTLEWLVDNVPEQYGMLKKKKKKEYGDGSSISAAVGSERRGKEEKANKEEEKKSQSLRSSLWTERHDVLIACNRRHDLVPSMSVHAPLAAGVCGGDPGEFHVGPELGFGWSVGDALNENDGSSDDGEFEMKRDRILLLKVAWGGKSLAVDFRPPSASGGATDMTTGPYYTSMIQNVRGTMRDIGKYFPAERGRPLLLSGFGWHQGWNDGILQNRTDEYESNLADLIRDVRTDLNAPDLPFVIATTGMVGYRPKGHGHPWGKLEAAEMAVAGYPEFNGTVAAVDTRPFARDAKPASPTTRRYHWMNNAESYWLVGRGMGDAMVGLVRRREARARMMVKAVVRQG